MPRPLHLILLTSFIRVTSSWGYEWAIVVEDSPKKIAIQHF
jgi:hypothetical protein